MEHNKQQFVHRVGEQLAKGLREFYGYVRFNIQNGKYVNSNVEQTIKPEEQSKKERTE